MSASKLTTKKLVVSASLLALLSGLAWGGDVTVYEKAPSVEELQRQLTGGSEPGKRKMKTRSIVFGDAPAAQEAAPAAPAAAAVPAAQAPAAPAAPMAAPAQILPPAAPQQVVAPQPTQPVAAPVAAVTHVPAAPAAASAPQTMQVSEKAIAFPINFRVNSSDIQPESLPFIDSIAGLLQKDPSIRLLIEGHTDMSGAAARNMSLSRERAFSVMNYLIDHYKIDPMRLVPVGKGFSEPLGGMEPTNPKNRRVQFRILG